MWLNLSSLTTLSVPSGKVLAGIAIGAYALFQTPVAAKPDTPKPVAQQPPQQQTAPAPDPAPISQEFGENPAMYKKFGVEGHTGRDIALDCGQDVKAHASGIVKLVGDDPKSYGKFTVTQDNLGYLHMQGHYQDIAVKKGDYVEKNQTVGKAGSTGNSTGCHEHWGVKGASTNNGFAGYIDPRDWIAMREKREAGKTCVYDVPKAYSDVICEAIKKYPADPAAVAAFIYWEHRGFEADPYSYNWGALCSPAGACGAAQFMPATWEAYGVDGDGDGKASRASFRDSVYSASNLIGKYTGTSPTQDQVGLAAIKYNCGPGCVGKPLPQETTEYRKAVINLWWKFGAN